MFSLSSDITFFLVRTQFPGNAGSVARALKNTEFNQLALVNPGFDPLDLEVRKYALNAKDLIEQAPVYSNLKEALSPFDLVIGTSRREGAYRKNMISLDELPKFLLQKQARKIGLLFGNEANGLDNDELAQCHTLLTIPANPEWGSYNLSQAVLLVAFELYRHRLSLSKIESIKEVASQKELEGFFEHLSVMLEEIGFVKNNNVEHIPRILRNAYYRASLTSIEVATLRGICRQVLWYKNSRITSQIPEGNNDKSN